MSSILGWLTAAAFVVLAVITARDALRSREQGRRYLTAAIVLLGVVAALSQAGSGRIINVLTIALFSLAGYALLRFRDALIPLSKLTRRLALAGLAAGIVASVPLSADPSAGFDPTFTAAAVVFVVTWCLNVGEPIVRFWRAARKLPAVQRARLRALSAGYAGMIAILVITFSSTLISSSKVIGVAIEMLALIIVPLLAASFAPPIWLRRFWRQGEEEAYTRATRDLLLASPGAATLSARGLEWAIRLIGADAGFVTDATGAAVAIQGITAAEAEGVFAGLPRERKVGTMRPRSVNTPALMQVPLQLDGSGGVLVVLSGPFTPVFGTDEMSRLEQYAVGLASALDRESLIEQVQRNAEDLEVRVTDRTRELQQTTSHTAAILENVAEAIATVDRAGAILSLNRAAENTFGVSEQEGMGRTLFDLLDPSCRGDMLAALTHGVDRNDGALDDSGFKGMYGLRATGERFPLEFRLSAVEGDDADLVVICMRDISERLRYTEELEYQALHDSLTGLPNRALFNDRLQQAIAHATRSKGAVTVLLIDLDQFKSVNDALGHSAGDTLLQRAADRLSAKLRASDTIARLGGDEFAILLSQSNQRDAAATARKLRLALGEPFLIDGKRIQVGASVGIAQYPEVAHDLESLMRRADVAMYAAKRTHAGHAFYTVGQDASLSLDLTVRGDLKRAVERDELVLHFQPIMSMASRRLDSVEALVRWNHPDLGLLPPDKFIPPVEAAGLIDDLTAWVLRTGLDGLQRLSQAGMEPDLAVNISPRTLLNAGLPEMIRRELKRAEISPARLRLEITETAVTTEKSGQMLNRLREAGLRLSIDDFGTGQSSLARLADLPLDELKVDRSFVIGMENSEGNEAIVRSTIEMAHRLKLEVVAEGVETWDSWAQLLALGCDKAQGYVIARPMPVSEMLNWQVDWPTPSPLIQVVSSAR